MDESVQTLFQQLGISLVLGLLVGLQRQKAEPQIAGLRTFPLITALGTIAATLDRAVFPTGGWIVPAMALAIAALVAASYFHRRRDAPAGMGITTEVAILLMYLVGAFLVTGDRVVAIAIGAGVAVLLQFKPELHGIVARLDDDDTRAIMTFVLITCVILPIIPDRTYDVVSPLNVLNPFRIWLMVVLMVGISLGGYLAYNFLGRTAGVLLGGLMGGIISSTATTVSYARRSRDNSAAAASGALVVMLATSVVYLRVLLEISVVAPAHFSQLWPPIGLMLGASLLATALLALRIPWKHEAMPKHKNPTELGSALLFAAIYAGVLMALAAAQDFMGVRALYGVAILSGATDMDAITLSTAHLVEAGATGGGIAASVGWRLIIVATMANHAVKWAICLCLGSRHLTRLVAFHFAIPMATGALLLRIWP